MSEAGDSNIIKTHNFNYEKYEGSQRQAQNHPVEMHIQLRKEPN
jgi:hypothetical protein